MREKKTKVFCKHIFTLNFYRPQIIGSFVKRRKKKETGSFGNSFFFLRLLKRIDTDMCVWGWGGEGCNTIDKYAGVEAKRKCVFQRTLTGCLECENRRRPSSRKFANEEWHKIKKRIGLGDAAKRSYDFLLRARTRSYAHGDTPMHLREA